MMKELSVGGKKYPFRMTMGALLRFKRKTGKEFSELTSGDVVMVVTLLYCIVAAASNAEGVEFTMELEEFADKLSMEDFTEATNSLFTPAEAEKKSK